MRKRNKSDPPWDRISLINQSVMESSLTACLLGQLGQWNFCSQTNYEMDFSQECKPIVLVLLQPTHTVSPCSWTDGSDGWPWRPLPQSAAGFPSPSNPRQAFNPGSDPETGKSLKPTIPFLTRSYSPRQAILRSWPTQTRPNQQQTHDLSLRKQALNHAWM